MAGLKQSKRVSWPTDGNLCKVRLFLSEDAPSQSGIGAQDHLQAKAAWLLHAAGLVDSDDSLPPGFEAPHKYHSKIEISQIPLVKWQCPPRIFLNPEWLVVAGEESQEVALENQRQPGVLEAIYPRPSSIPPNPLVIPEVQHSLVDDSCTPLIPITPIEDEDGIEQLDRVTALYTSTQLQSLSNVGTAQHYNTPDLRFTVDQLKSQPNVVAPIPNLPPAEQPPLAAVMLDVGSAPSVEPDVLAAASAAFTAIMRSSEEGSLIDRDLLIKILSNPAMVEKLVSEYASPKQTLSPPPLQQLVAPTSAAPSQSPQIPLSAPISAPPTSHIFQVPNMVAPALNPPHYPPVHMPIVPLVKAPPVKDANYYKSLIQLHGGDKQEPADQNPVQFGNLGNSLDYHNNMTLMGNGSDPIGPGGLKQRDLKPKILKPCAYFNTPRGCRHGASCLYQHDASIPQRIEQQKGTTKRIKLDRGIAGRD